MPSASRRAQAGPSWWRTPRRCCASPRTATHARALARAGHGGHDGRAPHGPASFTWPLPIEAWASPVSVSWAGPLDGNKAFTGREWDPEMGWYYYRARYYDPKVGRFVSEDPSGLDGGTNAYRYVEAQPLAATDPNGLRPFEIYNNADDAARDAMREIWGPQQREERAARRAVPRREANELKGMICQCRDDMGAGPEGRFYYQPAEVMSGDDRSLPKRCSGGNNDYAFYHSHPFGDWDRLFSTPDNVTIAGGLIGYLLDPYGTMWVKKPGWPAQSRIGEVGQ